ncbi:MAG TPA: CPBP family intramembrane glutamic endopeptidase [Chromatiaceae bacterium]|nr:CPBP family intramembrane glutamic endopeptidase [Chromatiaceae bacterium]
MNRRILLALGAFVIWTAITVIGGRLRAGGETELVEAVTQGVNWVYPLAAAFLLAVVAWQRWDDVGLKTAPAAGSLRLLWLPALYIAGFLVLGVLLGLPPIAVIFFVLVNTFFVGLSEELMFRGILLQALRHRMAIWPAILVTSLLFGAVHSLNVFATGHLLTAVVQSGAALLSGLLFIAIRLRTGSLWPAIVVHGLWDFGVFTMGAAGGAPAGPATAPTSFQTFAPVLLVLPTALYALWLLRHVARTHARPED